MREPPSQMTQIVGSLLVALAIAAVAVAVVTAHFGPTSHAELEGREERIDQRVDAREERREAAAERREEQAGR
ncbi:MAG TPA: hypothetical protein VLI94_12320 [Solirubrobacterales bacterium]|nr:hypothetical protein [Solirubrobacterales bacterium]